MSVTERLINAIRDTVWGAPMLFLVMGCGVYLTLNLRVFQLTRMKLWVMETFGSLIGKSSGNREAISPRSAVFAALASSIGTGNIVGVATAIVSGGAGAVFWMWVSAFFGMAVKYAEIFLAVRFREKRGKVYHGGPMFYIEKGLGKGYKWLSVMFSVSGALACLGMGAMSQASSVSSVMTSSALVPGWACGIVLALMSFFAAEGGIKRISSLTQVIVPIMAGMYIIGGVGVIVLAPKEAASALGEIFTAALLPRSVYGAAAGQVVKKAMRLGVSRGVFSNEAGLGSGAIVHSAADAKSPMHQGFWGMFEVFVDTIAVCTVTAIVILAAGKEGSGLNGGVLVAASFSEFFGESGGVFVSCATVLFALSTILGWSYYGEECMVYITGESKRVRRVYRGIFACSVMVGAVSCLESVWSLADMFNGIMMLPNLIAVLLLSGLVIRETKEKLPTL